MMTSERILSHGLDGKVRDVMELILLNAALGGGNLDGMKFSYENKLATFGNETATRNDWFEGEHETPCDGVICHLHVTDISSLVCCCPPNLSRTLGLLGGYTWTSKVDISIKTINLDIYLYLSASRNISLPGGGEAKVEMKSEMPWNGRTELSFSAPEGWKWTVRVPKPDYAADVKVSIYLVHIKSFPR